jgi:hypothetical protein
MGAFENSSLSPIPSTFSESSPPALSAAVPASIRSKSLPFHSTLFATHVTPVSLGQRGIRGDNSGTTVGRSSKLTNDLRAQSLAKWRKPESPQKEAEKRPLRR